MITVVTGLPRSGTSLAMQMIEAAGIPLFTDNARPADESNPRGYFESELVKTITRDQSWIGQAEGRAIKVVIPLVVSLPLDRDLRVILMLRRIDEVIASQARMMKRMGKKSMAPETLQPVFQSQVERSLSWLQQHHVNSLKLQFIDLIRSPLHHARQIVSFVESGSPEAVASVVAARSLSRKSWIWPTRPILDDGTGATFRRVTRTPSSVKP